MNRSAADVSDVAIVGLGPVGNVLAILLAQLGRSVVVLERWAEPYRLPRAVHIDHEAARILQSCGLGADLAATSEPADVYEWRNAAGEVLLRLENSGHGSCGWPQSSMINQPAVEDLLAARAAALPGIEVRRGVEVSGLAQDDDGVTLHLVGGGEAVARYVVGCDGANSTVRTAVAAPVHDLGFFYDWLIVDVVLHEPRVFDPINQQLCDPARPTTAVSGGPGRRRWEFMRLPDESIAELDDEATAWRLLEPWDVTPANATLERHAVYTFQARWAERWRTGRVLLAGDAAHQMPPFAGQGLCAGLRDASNLAWKLDLVLDGRAADDLLDTYQTERVPHVRGVIELSMDLGRLICEPPPATGTTMAMPDLPGRLFPQHDRLDDVVGVGWRLFHLPGVAVPDDGWFSSIGGRAVEVDDRYRAWFERQDATVAVMRPDFHVAAVGTDAGDALAGLRADAQWQRAGTADLPA